jgi:hypothetical protein
MLDRDTGISLKLKRPDEKTHAISSHSPGNRAAKKPYQIRGQLP